MKSYNYFIISLFIIGIIIVTKEITIRLYKCPNVKENISPIDINDIDHDLTIDQNFKSMFSEPSPWPGTY